jgi:hypothetical protein
MNNNNYSNAVCVCKKDTCVCAHGKAADVVLGLGIAALIGWGLSKLFK